MLTVTHSCHSIKICVSKILTCAVNFKYHSIWQRWKCWVRNTFHRCLSFTTSLWRICCDWYIWLAQEISYTFYISPMFYFVSFFPLTMDKTPISKYCITWLLLASFLHWIYCTVCLSCYYKANIIINNCLCTSFSVALCLQDETNVSHRSTIFSGQTTRYSDIKMWQNVWVEACRLACLCQ